MATAKPTPSAETETLKRHLDYLKLSFIGEHLDDFAKLAAEQHWDPITFLAKLIEGEAQRRQDRSIERRVRLARFPVRKSLEQFQWNWPKKINRAQVQNLFRLAFLDDNTNVVFIGGVGLGKSHLATPPWVWPPATRVTRSSLRPPSTSSTPSPALKPPVDSSSNCENTPALAF